MQPTSNGPGNLDLQRAVLDVVGRAIDLPTDERSAFVDLQCLGDPVLHDLVVRMLQSERKAAEFLDQPAEESSILFRSDESDTDLPVQSIGPYELIRRIGRGGMGNVYIARQRGDGYIRHVAIKIVKRGMDTDAVLGRFRVERHILASLTHPAIAKLLDGGTTDDGLAYFVMEYVKGIPISNYADTHRLSIDARLALFQEVCRAVHYAHQNLVVHRDLKPSNILVTNEGHIKLLDFGIAKLLNPDLSGLTVPFTSLDVQFLTPEYASPEHIRRETISTRSDVYSLGVLLYELLTGHRPFAMSGNTYPDIIHAICNTEPTRPSDVVVSSALKTRTDGFKEKVSAEELSRRRSSTGTALSKTLSGDLDTIVLTSLRKEPDERYASAEQLREDVVRYREGQPIAARRASVAYRLKKFYGRNRLSTWAVGVGIAMLLALTSTWIVTLAHQRNEARSALRRSENVKQFMVNVLGQGAVDSATDDTRTSAALTLVRPALDELGSTVGDDHGTAVAILNTVANLLTFNGDLHAPDSLLRRALVLSALGGVPEEDRLETLFQIGVLHFHRAMPDSAQKYVGDAYRGRLRLFGPRDARTLEAMKYWAWLHEYSENKELYNETIRLHELKYGPNSTKVADLLSDIGQGVNKVELLERSLAIYEMRGDRSGAAGVMASISVGLDRKDPARSLEMSERAHSILKETLGPDHVHTLTTSANLGAMYYDRGLYDLADSILTDVANRREALMPGSSLSSPSVLYYRALTKRGLGDFASSEALFKHSLATLPEDHSMYTVILRYTASVIAQQGRKHEARTMLREERERLSTNLSANEPAVTKIDQEIAGLE